VEDAVYYGVGMALGITIGAAIGQALVKEHGNRRILPFALALSVVFGLVLGWSIDSYIHFVHASATLHF
jgi:uncharacterized membrane protein YfcA